MFVFNIVDSVFNFGIALLILFLTDLAILYSNGGKSKPVLLLNFITWVLFLTAIFMVEILNFLMSLWVFLKNLPFKIDDYIIAYLSNPMLITFKIVAIETIAIISITFLFLIPILLSSFSIGLYKSIFYDMSRSKYK